ncbi:hypothetical protein ACFOGJ_15855 [Marinibaculum pumilum]|uniref:Uncharacterized protein n=1 Tax=Marinibaculum pumilum TaxID=1766165 RepID=A0ABV7L2K5_9PROT
MKANFCPAFQSIALRTDLGIEIWKLLERVAISLFDMTGLLSITGWQNVPSPAGLIANDAYGCRIGATTTPEGSQR